MTKCNDTPTYIPRLLSMIFLSHAHCRVHFEPLKHRPFQHKSDAMSVDEFGWFTINILIPIFLPLLGVLPFKMMSLPEGVEVRLISLVKDGQWCWTAIFIGTSSMYELWDANTRNLVLAEFAGLCLFLNSSILVVAMSFASGGAIFKTPILDRSLSFFNWISNYRTFVASFFLILFTVCSSSAQHFYLTRLNNLTL